MLIRKSKKILRSHKKESLVVDSTIHGKAFPDPPLTEIFPNMYFKQFFDDDLIKHTADQTNLYSVQCTGKSINVDENEIEQYFGILLLMSVIKLPQVRMYWSEETRILRIADMVIRQYFHCNDNSSCPSKSRQNYDKLFKVRPVIDSVLYQCKSVPQEEM